MTYRINQFLQLELFIIVSCVWKNNVINVKLKKFKKLEKSFPLLDPLLAFKLFKISIFGVLAKGQGRLNE
jgi:hypothetical protein